MIISYYTLHHAHSFPPVSSNHENALLNARYLILLLRLRLLSCVLEVVLEDWLWVGGESLLCIRRCIFLWLEWKRTARLVLGLLLIVGAVVDTLSTSVASLLGVRLGVWGWRLAALVGGRHYVCGLSWREWF